MKIMSHPHVDGESEDVPDNCGRENVALFSLVELIDPNDLITYLSTFQTNMYFLIRSTSLN